MSEFTYGIAREQSKEIRESIGISYNPVTYISDVCGF